MKRVLLTGISGSIGIHVFDHIMLNTDWEVIGIATYRHKGYYDRIGQTLDHNPHWIPRLTMLTHDLTAPFSPREVMKMGKIDYIINLASLADVWDSVDDPVPFIRNNVEIVLTMLELARKLKPAAFVQFSTDEVYGPAKVDQAHPEWATMLPSNPYSASKAAQEMIAIAYWRSYGVPVIITNTMNNFGEMQGPSKYPVMIQKKLNAGETVTVHAAGDGQIGTRYYIHSRNAADAVLYILQHTTPYMHRPGEVDRPDKYNVVGSAQVDNLELAKVIARLMGKELKYELLDFHSKEPGHDLHYGLDGTKLERLGWKPKVGFEESLKRTIDWQQTNEEWINEEWINEDTHPTRHAA